MAKTQELMLTYFMQIHERLLQPASEQPGSLRCFAFIQEAMQRSVLAGGILSDYNVSRQIMLLGKGSRGTLSPTRPSARSALASSFMNRERSCVFNVYAL